jgi:hypothetical protein
MSTKSGPLFALLLICTIAASALIVGFTRYSPVKPESAPLPACCQKPKSAECVFRTVLNLEDFDTIGLMRNSTTVKTAIQNALSWIAQAQGNDGGWGAGSHLHQEILDPHAVEADPATTALVGMALLRCGNTLSAGAYAENLRKAMNYLLLTVENTPTNQIKITTLSNTQPQVKLGQNIDVILAAQFLSNLTKRVNDEPRTMHRIEKDLKICIDKIQRGQDTDGGWKDGGWAPVLQSALANNALESARDQGFKVDSTVMEKSRDYQEGNFDPRTSSVITGKSAGVLLYAISGSGRATAKEANLAQISINQAKKEGKLKKEDKITEDNLVVAGMSRPTAKKYMTAYRINQVATTKAQSEDIMSGFGSNGGEEFLSYLMTGESLVMNGGPEWLNWYNNMTGRLIQIQNNEGSWSGHHCITSPVFCTATCLLVLSIDRDL